MDNPYGVIPVFHLRTDRPYGEPCHRGFYGPQDTVNKLIIGHMAGWTTPRSRSGTRS